MDAKFALAEPRLQLSTHALRHNARVVRDAVAPGVAVCAVVKADAYGHGAAAVAKALAPHVEGFAVATIDEAVAVSMLGKPTMILRPVENVLLGRHRDAIELAVRAQWTLTVATVAAAEDIARVAVSCGARARVQLMLDTGLTRCGMALGGMSSTAPGDVIARLKRNNALHLVAVATHFANGDVRGDAFTSEQLKRFRDATEEPCEKLNVRRHAANSGGVFFTPRGHFDLVRPGLSLYGIDPTGKPNTGRPLRPVVRWCAPLTVLHDVAAGQTVGYGQAFRAERRMRLAVVPVGYADGYARALSGKGVMTVAGVDCPVVGRVSMDMTTIDVTHVPDVALGDEAIVMSDDPLAINSVYRLADWCDTIPYEVLTRLGGRLKRVLIDDTHDAPTPDSSDRMN